MCRAAHRGRPWREYRPDRRKLYPVYRMAEPPDGQRGRQGAGPWQGVADGVLRGLAHQLSNRTGTIGAVAEALAASEPESRLVAALRGESAQLEELLRLLRLMSRDAGRGAEPVRPLDVVSDAVSLFAYHPAGYGARATLDGVERVPPVRAHVPAFTHAVLLLLAAAAGPEGAPVTVRGGDDPRQARIAVAGPGAAGPGAGRPAREATAILAADGGSVVAHDLDRDGGPGPAFVLLLPALRPGRD